MATIQDKYTMDRERQGKTHVLSENILRMKELYQNSSIRTMCVVFASLFNNITTPTFKRDGSLQGERVVPISFVGQSSLGYWMENRIQQCKEKSPIEVGRMFPLMTYELLTLTRNATEQLNTQNMVLGGTVVDGTKVLGKSIPVPVPYIFGFSLNIFSQTYHSALYILDQILPCFSPEIGIKIIEIPELGLKQNIRIEIENITLTDNYMEVFEKNRIIQWQLTFNVYGDIVPRASYKTSTLITQMQVDMVENVNTNLERWYADGRPPIEEGDYENIKYKLVPDTEMDNPTFETEEKE